jgi:mRNA interferase YafQ
MARERPPLTARPTSRFEKELKRQVRRGLEPVKLYNVVTALCQRQPLPASLRDHALKGKWTGWRDCHIEPDWVLIYRVDPDANELVLGRTGTHADVLE